MAKAAVNGFFKLHLYCWSIIYIFQWNTAVSFDDVIRFFYKKINEYMIQSWFRATYEVVVVVAAAMVVALAMQTEEYNV